MVAIMQAHAWACALAIAPPKQGEMLLSSNYSRVNCKFGQPSRSSKTNVWWKQARRRASPTCAALLPSKPAVDGASTDLKILSKRFVEVCERAAERSCRTDFVPPRVAQFPEPVVGYARPCTVGFAILDDKPYGRRSTLEACRGGGSHCSNNWSQVGG